LGHKNPNSHLANLGLVALCNELGQGTRRCGVSLFTCIGNILRNLEQAQNNVIGIDGSQDLGVPNAKLPETSASIDF